MDLGISGRNAIVCASSRGLGLACATELARAGARVVINGRDERRLSEVRDRLAKDSGADILAIAADVTTPKGREALLEAMPKPDILVNNAAGPPPRDFREIDRDSMIAGLEANMMAPIFMIQAVLDSMVERGFGRIVNITSGSVKMPIAGLDLSSGARAGLTGFLGGVARSVAHANVTINHLLPGSFDTDRIAALIEKQSQRAGEPAEVIRRRREQNIPSKRFGDPAEFGAACAFLCSAQAGYITGQSILIDGGAFPGLL